jgi:polysaccharide export outer membrane protein
MTLIMSCGPQRNITYLSNLGNTVENKKMTEQTTLIIKPDDLLGITVSSLSVETNALFNRGEGVEDNVGYLVDKDGMIEFPLVGAVSLLGLTKAEAKEKLIEKLNAYVKDPIVGIRLLNFKVTVLGEVNNPSSFRIPAENVNLLEALGMAGDLTVYGKRENVLLIREHGDVRTTVRLNLNDKEILNSPYFYLQQNDILYVEPDKAKVIQTSLRRSNLQFGISVTISIISIVTLLLTRL